MTPKQKLELRRSEIRTALGAIAELSGDDLTDDKVAERDKLMTELRESEPQLRAAIEAEEAETRQRGDQIDQDGESAEYRSLCERSRLAAFVGEVHRQTVLEGSEAELRSAVFGDRARPGLVPFEMLIPLNEKREAVEKRADAPTNVADNAGAMSHPILQRVFARTVAAFMGVSMQSVERGVSAHPVIADGVAPEMKSKGAVKDAEAATVNIEALEPRRLTARYLMRVEDLARIDGLEEALRMDLASALGEKMDQQVISGDGNAPKVSGLLTTIAAPDVPGAVVNFGTMAGIAGQAVDGKGAASVMETRILAALDVYRKAAELVGADGATFADDSLMRRTGGLRATPHIPNAPDGGARDKTGELLIARMMAPGSAVAPIWSGFEMTLRDDLTGAAEGEIALTALMLWNFKLLRMDGFARASVKLA